MSKQSNLLLRNGRFYFRTRVPKDLVTIIGKKEIKKALGTSNRSEAKRRLPIEQLEAEETFEKARNTKLTHQPAPISLDRTSIERRIILWHQNEIVKHATEDDAIRINSSAEERIQIVDTLREELSVFDGGDESQYASGIQKITKALIPELDCNKQINEYHFAQSLVQQSLIEHTYRRLERFGDSYNRTPFHLFSAQNLQVMLLQPQESHPSIITFGALITKFKAAKKSDGITDAALKKYKIPFDFSLELFGDDKPLSSISTEDCREFRDELLKLPSNARKRYPKLSLLDCIKANSKHGKSTLSITSINDNLGYLTAVFNFAVREGYLKRNPSQHIPNLKQKKNKEDGRQPFSESYLQKLFQAPIFTGCIDDEWNYKSIGTNKPSRHKFWIPLIALHTGMRLNEICQLFASDIICIDGIHIIRSIINDENEKTLKTDSSERDVPIHNQLIQIGFLGYVKRIKSQGHKRLFPDMTPDSKGKYSSNFSKWFARFLKSNNIKFEGICFHSFRHNFRDAIRESYMNKDLGAALGGWKASKDTMDQYGAGYQLKSLNKAMQQMEFNVELKHLFQQ
ncbi:MAG: site-specific integrase [Colwellia sp.]|nr:site-specific integrase [Colwellia sp.]